MGGTADVTARLIAEKLRGSYAQTSLVDSRSGAGGRIAVDAPPADGATSLMTPMSTIAIYPHVFKSLSYNPFKHLAPVSLAATFTLGLAIGPAVPASVTDVRGLLDWMRANPKMGGLRVALGRHHTAFSGSADLADFGHGIAASALSRLRSRHLRSDGRADSFDDHRPGRLFAASRLRQAACDRNLGGDPLALCASGADLGRIGISQHRVRRVAGFVCPGQDSSTADLGGVGAALRAGGIGEQMRTFMSVFGLEPRTSSPEELASLMRVDFERWAPIIKATGFTAES